MFKALVYTIYWMVINIVFGLLPLGAIVYGQLARFPSDLERVIKDGAVTYFALALMGSVLVDFTISKLRFPRIGQALIYMFPLICVALIFPILLLEYINGKLQIGHGTVSTLRITQNVAILISTIYCLPLTFAIFITEINESSYG